MLRSLFNATAVILFTAFFGAAATLFGRLLPRSPLGYRMAHRWARALLFFCSVRVEIRGREHLDLSRPRLYMTNHRSHFDTPVIMGSFPVPLCFVAKKELRRIPLMGGGMAAVGMIFLDRGDSDQARASLEAAAGRIRGGRNVLMFPEGTRSNDGVTLGPFKKGAFHLALKAGVPIQPVAVTGSERVLPKHSLSVRPGPVVLHIGPPVEVGPDDTVESLLNRTRAAIGALIAQADAPGPSPKP